MAMGLGERYKMTGIWSEPHMGPGARWWLKGRVRRLVRARSGRPLPPL